METGRETVRWERWLGPLRLRSAEEQPVWANGGRVWSGWKGRRCTGSFLPKSLHVCTGVRDRDCLVRTVCKSENLETV